MALNKNNKLLLADYLKDSSDLRLSLFATSVNAQFKIDKKTKEQLKLLLSDYAKDPSSARLKVIESYLNANVQSSPNRIKPSDIKAAKVTPAQIESNEAYKELKPLQEQILRLRRSYASAPSQATANEIGEVESKIRALETKLGMFDEQPPEKSQLDIILGLLGHWDNPSSMAYELINGSRPRLTIRSGSDMKDVLKWLANLSGKPVRPFMLQNDDMSGTGNGRKDGNKNWILTDTRSGIAPIKDNFVSQIINGSGGLQESPIDLMASVGSVLPPQ